MAILARTVLARPNHPARLAGVFAASLAAFALVAAAAVAALYVFDSETGSDATTTGGLPVNAEVDLPAGMVLVRNVADADAWEAELGFAPVEPEALPNGVGDALFYVQQPDAAGRSAGHLRYTTEDGGLLLVVVEQQGTIANDRPMRSGETTMTREHIESFGCGTIVVTAQLFFSLDTPGAPDAMASLAIADDFVAGMREQCG